MRSRWLAPTLLRAWMLAALLLAAQAAGLAHRVAHMPGLPGTAHAAAAVAGADHEAGTADCRLIDQLTHADALCAPPLALPQLPPAPADAVQPLQLRLGAAALAGYLARAPPQA